MPATKKAEKKPAAKKTSASKKATPTSNDAISLLKADHAEVSALFEQYQELVEAEAEDADKEALALQICTMLTVHAQIEEEIFYPAARGVLEEQDLIDEADVEHASAKDLIAQIESASAGDDHYDAKVTVLGEYINHHVEEEEGEMFPKIKKTDLDLAAIGEELLARKQELLVELGAAEGTA